LIAHLEEATLYQNDANAVIDVITKLLLDPPNIDIARHFPLPEYSSLTELLLESSSCGTPLPIVVPVCPDYPESGYQLGGGAGLTARRFLHRFPFLRQLFADHGLDVSVEIDVADVEILDPIISKRLAMTKDGFFRRINSTIEEIRKEGFRRGFGNSVTVGSMTDRFTERGVDYTSRQQELAAQILGHSGRKIRQVMAGLVKERIANEDYQDLGVATETEFREAAAYELAGYAVYGEMIGPDALICSPDAQSAVPGYNFLKKDSSTISPTAFIKPPRREHGSLFAD
jgi:hypothetical protein